MGTRLSGRGEVGIGWGGLLWQPRGESKINKGIRGEKGLKYLWSVGGGEW